MISLYRCKRWLGSSLAPLTALLAIPLLFANQSSWKSQRLAMVEKQIAKQDMADLLHYLMSVE